MSIFDLVRVREVLRTVCQSDVPLGQLEVSYMQAGPDGPTRVLYEGPGRNGDPLRVAARRVDADRGRRLEASINARSFPSSSSGFFHAALYAPALDVLFQIFPADDRLPTLPVAIDPSAMTAVLESALAPPGAGARLQALEVRVIRYKPERKCLLRYDLGWAGDRHGVMPDVVWARVSRKAKFDRIRENLSRLYAASTDVGFELPRPLGVLPNLAMELSGPVPGIPLFGLVQSDTFPAVCRRAGKGLRRFHNLSVDVAAMFDVEAQVSRLAENATECAWMLPSERGRIIAIERELSARLRAATPSPPSPIHCDFHGDNVLVSDTTHLALIDFEDCAMGEPADDVGSNWAQLTWHIHRAAEKDGLPKAGRRAFLEGYLEDTDASILQSISTYAAMHCFLYAHQCLRHPRDAARDEDALVMMTVCQDVLRHGLRI